MDHLGMGNAGHSGKAGDKGNAGQVGNVCNSGNVVKLDIRRHIGNLG